MGVECGPCWLGGRQAFSTDLGTHRVTLSLETIRVDKEIEDAFSWLPFLPKEALGRREHSTFDLDEEDLDHLIQTLQAAKAALGRVRSGG